MAKIPSIEECFQMYVDTHLSGPDPLTEDEQRRAFFLGFQSCFTAFDAIAEIQDTDETAGNDAWERLDAELERFAIASDFGIKSTHH